MSELHEHSAADLARLVAARTVSPVEIVTGLIERIGEIDPHINAFCALAELEALSVAKEAERDVVVGRDIGPLHGVPVAIKDATATKGLRTTFGSRAFETYVPAEDALVVARLRDAGAIVIGKTTTPEFGCKGVCESPLLGRTNNPWDVRFTAGGSSGGSAAAISAQMIPIAEGSDGAGSVRIPASACGVVGLKPSFGRMPLHPRGSFESLVHQGPMARTVEDVALMLAAMAGPSAHEVYGLTEDAGAVAMPAGDPDVRGWRIAYSPDLGLGPVDPEVRCLTAAAAAAFVDLGAHVEEISLRLPDPREPMMTIWKTVYGSIAKSRIVPRVGRDGMDPDLLELMDASDSIDAVTYYDAAFGFRNDFFQAMLEVFDDHRILLTPTLTVPPFVHPERGLYPVGIDGTDAERFLGWFLTYPFNLTGQPALSMPCGLSSDGMPIGLQIVGRPRADVDVLLAGAAYEAAAGFAGLRPPPILV